MDKIFFFNIQRLYHNFKINLNKKKVFSKNCNGQNSKGQRRPWFVAYATFLLNVFDKKVHKRTQPLFLDQKKKTQPLWPPSISFYCVPNPNNFNNLTFY